MRYFLLILCCVSLCYLPANAQKKIDVTVTPNDASIYEVMPESNELKLLGIGVATVAVPKKSESKIILRKTGYADVVKVYDALGDDKLPKKDLLVMKDRQVALKLYPADVKVFANGSELQSGTESIIIRDGEKIELELKKPGYVSLKKSYSNATGAETPPANDELRLTNRIVQIVASPSDARILVDDVEKSVGNADIIIPENQCVVVTVIKDGYVKSEQTYCNKEGSKPLPLNATLALQDRFVTIKSDHADARILINGREVAKGSYGIKVARGECVDVIIEKEGFIPSKKTFCNQDNAPVFGMVDSVGLIMDESFSTSSPADYVNVNNIIEISPGKQEEAWSIMSRAVLSAFDVIEITDKETGYLLTAWAHNNFPNNTIRTRVIVKVADSNNLKYAVKLSSEYSGVGGSNINDDSLFKEWNRVLNKYQDLIIKIQEGLK